MSNLQNKRNSGLVRNAKKAGAAALLVAAVAGTSYALYKQEGINPSTARTSLISTIPASATLQSIATSTSDALIVPPATSVGMYLDGEYTGDSVRADHWGNVQAKAIIQNGQLTDIQILDYPRSRSFSVSISRNVLPYLMQEAVQTQSASVDIVSGATFTSQAFTESLQSALDDASTGQSL